jgi:hypothetical protein
MNLNNFNVDFINNNYYVARIIINKSFNIQLYFDT